MTNLFPLKIVFSENFEELYKKLRAEILGVQKLTEVEKTDNLEIHPPILNLPTNFDVVRRAQHTALKNMIKEEELIDRISGRVQENIKDLVSVNKEEKLSGKIVFDDNRGILYINNGEMKTQKYSKQYEVLKILFKNKDSQNKDWQLEEIFEIIDPAEDIKNWKKIYNIISALKKNIAAETGVKDFFITTTQSVKINPKYLKSS